MGIIFGAIITLLVIGWIISTVDSVMDDSNNQMVDKAEAMKKLEEKYREK